MDFSIFSTKVCEKNPASISLPEGRELHGFGDWGWAWGNVYEGGGTGTG